MILWSMMDDLMIHDMLWFSFWTYMMMCTWMRGCMGGVCFFSFFYFSFILIWEQGKLGLKARKKTVRPKRTGFRGQCGN